MTARPWIEAFAPATVSNLGPGFDCLGLALCAWGDRVRARRAEAPGVRILDVTGDEGKLPREAERNTASVAVLALLELAGRRGEGVELEVHKGLPLGSGLGSSGASAVAAVVAADAALELQATPEQLVDAAREGERLACGAAHPDNVAPAVLGGVVLIPRIEPLQLVALPAPERLWITVYTPGHPVATADARAVLPQQVPLGAAVRHAARLGLLVHALHTGDLQQLGEAIVDELVEPARASLIPGFAEAKVAAYEAGALACSISGSGPTTFALTDTEGRARALLEILHEAFEQAGVPGKGLVDRIGPGARVTTPALH